MALRLTFERWPANPLGYGRHQIHGHHKRQPPRWFSCPCRGCTSSSNRWSQPRSSRPSSSRLQFLFRRDAGVFLVLFALMPRNWITNIKTSVPNTLLDSNVALLRDRTRLWRQNDYRIILRNVNRGEALFNITRTPPAARKVLGAWPIFSRDVGSLGSNLRATAKMLLLEDVTWTTLKATTLKATPLGVRKGIPYAGDRTKRNKIRM